MGPVPELDTLGKRLRFVRDSLLGLSARKAQEELKSAGVDVDSHSTVLRYEADKRTPGADYVLFFVQRAGVDAHWLLTGEGEMKPVQRSTAERAFEVIATVVDEARAISAGGDGEAVLARYQEVQRLVESTRTDQGRRKAQGDQG